MTLVVEKRKDSKRQTCKNHLQKKDEDTEL